MVVMEAVARALKAYVDHDQPEAWCKGYTTRAMCRIASNGVENIRESNGEPSYIDTRWGCELYAYMWGASDNPPNPKLTLDAPRASVRSEETP